MYIDIVPRDAKNSCIHRVKKINAIVIRSCVHTELRVSERPCNNDAVQQ